MNTVVTLTVLIALVLSTVSIYYPKELHSHSRIALFYIHNSHTREVRVKNIHFYHDSFISPQNIQRFALRRGDCI